MALTPDRRTLAAARLRLARRLAIGGPTFTGQRPTGGTPKTQPTFAALSSRTLYFRPVDLERWSRAFPEVATWQAPWLLFAALGIDVQARDVYTDGAHAYVITDAPVTYPGFLLAPAATTAVPAPIVGAVSAILLELGDFLVTEAGDHLILEAA